MDISNSTKVKIFLQKFLGNIAFTIIGISVIILIKYYFKYTIKDRKKHKKFYKELLKQKRPLLICSNHLTMIDSVLIQYTFGDYFFYLLNYKAFAWNVPAKEVFAKNLISNVFLFLSKCIPLDRKGSLEYHEMMLNQIKYILTMNEPFIIFPEGGRSRKGRFDIENITYGVGRIVYDLKNVNVLCVYLRGNKQTHFTNLPEKNSDFFIAYKLIHPKTTASKRLVAEKELSLQIGQTIKQLEEQYFLLIAKNECL